MFVNNPLSSKSEQVSEQVFQPIRVPVIIGNDVYIVTQQDVRNIIETRHISCFKCPNGLRDLQDFFAHSNPTQPQQNNSQQNNNNSFQNISQYLDTINNATNLVQCHCSQTGASAQTQKSPSNIAPLRAQIDWESKDCNGIKPDQFTYTRRTSTTDLRDFNVKLDCNKGSYNPRHIIKILISKGTNVSASEILEDIEQQKMEVECSSPTAQEQRKQKKQLESNHQL